MIQAARFCQLVEDELWSAAKDAYQRIVGGYRPDNNGKQWRIRAERIAISLAGK
jgi:hypothetical protein